MVKLADNNITCTVDGPARLLGLEGADNTDTGDYRDNRQRVYNGRVGCWPISRPPEKREKSM